MERNYVAIMDLSGTREEVVEGRTVNALHNLKVHARPHEDFNVRTIM